MVPATVLCVLFVVLSVLHWYWVVSGEIAGGLAVPEIDGDPVFQPGRIATATVALLLLFAALVVAAEGRLLGAGRLPVTRLGVWVLLVLFLLRAMGDFRLVGIFKSVRGTRFAQLDTWVYSPLCLVIAGLCGWLLWETRHVL